MRVHKKYPSRSFPSDRRAWLIFILVFVIGGTVAYAWFHRRVLKTPSMSQIVEVRPYQLAVLEFGRVTKKPTETGLTAAKMEGYIRALKAQGFVPVRASEVIDAFQRGIPLPPKSVLLSFDGGYLSTYAAVHDLLAREKCPALMLLESGCQERRDSAFLYWDRLSLMLDSGIWELGTHGFIRAKKGHDDSAKTGEMAFQESKKFIESHLSKAKVQVYSPLVGHTPLLSEGQESVNGPALAFHADLFGINVQGTNPRKLRRLHVEPAWSSEQLLRRLEWSMADPKEMANANDLLPRWVPDRPELVSWADGLVLDGAWRNSVWLAGSCWAEDWVLEARVRIDSGEFWFIQEHDFGKRHWRFGGKDGKLYFQDRTPGSPPVTLARVTFESGTIYGWHDFRITRRGPGVLVECDGHPLGDRPFQLPERVGGYVGITSAPSDHAGRLVIARTNFRPFDAKTAVTSSNPTESEVQQFATQVINIGALSPAWMQCGKETREVQPLDSALLGILRNRFAWDILPEVRIEDAACSWGWLADLPGQIKAAGWDGVCINLDALNADARASWQPALANLRRELESHGLRLQVAPAPETKGDLR